MKFLKLLFLLISAALVAAPATAQSFPSKTVRMIVPYAAGGEHDALGRSIARGLSEKWKQPVIVENRVGGGSVIGTDVAVKAEADGHTLLFTSVGFVTSRLTGQKLPYDPAELQPLVLVSTTPLILYVNASMPTQNLRELIAYGKANAQGLSFGSSGNGSSLHLAAELFAAMAGVEITHVPYKGIAPALVDLLAGTTKAMWAPPSLLSQAKLRPLVAANPTRLISAPQLPTSDESGLPGLHAASWSGFFVHSKTPAAVRDQIYADMREVVNSPAIREQILRYNYEPSTIDRIQFGDFLNNELTKWGKVIQERKLKLE